MGRKFKVDIDRRPPELAFTAPMECSSVNQLPEGGDWSYEIKLDGYRAQALHTPGGLRLLSRNGKDLGARYPEMLPDLAMCVPPGAAVDGELCALDELGHSSFQLLQHGPGAKAHLAFYAFDLLALSGRDMTKLQLAQRRMMLRNFLCTSDTVQITESYDLKAGQMLKLVRQHGLEGVVAKRATSIYEPGQRSGSWMKLRIVRGQEFVIGGFTFGSYGFDALMIGYYHAGRLHYCARVRNGFVPATRLAVHRRLMPLTTKLCPFANLPEMGFNGMGQGFTADRMRECVWVRPITVAQFAFMEWTPSGHLRHSRFLGIRDDKDPRTVVREV
jgi:bifunctional non-homologous end joining protein LigD